MPTLEEILIKLERYGAGRGPTCVSYELVSALADHAVVLRARLAEHAQALDAATAAMEATATHRAGVEDVVTAARLYVYGGGAGPGLVAAVNTLDDREAQR